MDADGCAIVHMTLKLTDFASNLRLIFDAYSLCVDTELPLNDLWVIMRAEPRSDCCSGAGGEKIKYINTIT